MRALSRLPLLAILALATILVSAAPPAAHAHVFGAYGAGWAQGFEHPFSGLDHMLAMVAVGVWAAMIGGRAVWVLPVTFPLVMALGGLLAVAGVPVLGVEVGIAGSVLVMGLLVALAVRPPVGIGAAVVALFALFHGHAHGSELPEAASPILYGLGFVLATAILHAIGLAFGRVLRSPVGGRTVRVGGVAVALAGVAILAGV